MFVEAPQTPLEAAIDYAIQTARDKNNQTLCGFAARLFHNLPKLVIKAFHDSHPHLIADTGWRPSHKTKTIRLGPSIFAPVTAVNEMSSLTRLEAQTLLHEAINHAVLAAERHNNRAIAGFASRLFHELPRLVAKELAKSNPDITVDTQSMTVALQELLSEYAIANDRSSAASVR